MDNPETLATFGYTRHRRKTNKTRSNQEWTIQRHWQHLGTQDTGGRQTKQGAIKNGQSRDTGNIWVHKTQEEDKQNKGQSRMDNPETLATFGYTRHRRKTNKTQLRKLKWWATWTPPKSWGEPRSSQWVSSSCLL